MATIKFQLLSKSENAPIYLRLSVKRGQTPRTKTGLHINPKQWSTSNYPKTTTANNKKLKADLQDLEKYILDEVNNANTKGETINTAWLKHHIDVHFGRISITKKSDFITDAIQSIINEAPTRKNAKGGLGLSERRINSYKALKRVIKEYQKQQNLRVKDVDIKFAKDFLNFLLNEKKYQKSTSLKKLADLKTVCTDAEFYGIETNSQYKKIQSAKPNNENILYLSNKELQQIESTVLLSESLKNARKWLLLGCNIGQRGGDLLQLTENNFKTLNNLEVIQLKQQKTGKNVTIPVLEKTKEILKTGFPYKISTQKFNKHIKEVCKLSEINELINGSKIVVTEKGKGNKEKRKVNGLYPKWQLMASHVCRRSFCSNLYGTLPTPLIMSISAHSSEKMLLNYIGKDSLDYAQQIADFYTLQALKEKREPQLQIIKNASNQ
ncbi:tyrosine-type recombinase/integrase [Polaribacter sargassicola]|uniref:tyrosine-type recombinase/integrase n=1 Tax=Polaribacter sargassicola TaxID=2836891 RepID=UPI001F2A1088|nr:phage integrase SAM-like domain-containing protein [Polaribacter sp. DS7-9]MCG1035213.1 phage integrase SAM-like domain-containing protein [Polaribacter sp. DS7-9]